MVRSKRNVVVSLLITVVMLFSSFSFNVRADDNQGVRGYVERLYTCVLGRGYDEPGLNDWTNRMTVGGLSAAECAEGFFESTEFKEDSLSDSDYVELLYKVYLGRSSDPQGKAQWVDFLSSGMTRRRIRLGFVGSDEFNGICSSYNVVVGTITLSEPIDLYPEIARFVLHIYSSMLGRQADDSGLRLWVNEIVADNMCASDFIASISRSEEFGAGKMSDEEYIKALYRGVLGREPASADITSLISHKNENGLSRNYILKQICESVEFGNICAAYGIRNGSLENIDTMDVNPMVNAFIKNVYIGALGRNPDAAGWRGWVDAINGGRITACEAISTIFDSSEYKSRNRSDREYVGDCYLAILGRPASETEIDSWVTYLNKYCVTRRYIMKAISASSEFREKCERIGINCGVILTSEARDRNATLNAFIIGGYEGVYGCAPGAEALNTWADSLLGGTSTASDFMSVLYSTGAFLSKTPQEQVNSVYMSALGRTPGDIESSNALNIRNGQGVNGLVNSVVFSQEFAGRCNAVGISVYYRQGWNNTNYGRVYISGSSTLSGWQRIDGQRYYFDPSANNAMTTGWKFIDGLKYYFDSNGALVQNVDGILGPRSSYYLTVNCATNTIMVYAQDIPGGAYNIPVKAITCSTGLSGTPTIQGDFIVRRFARWGTLMGPCYGQYCSQISGNYLFHSCWYYINGDATSLGVNQYNMLGNNASHGCVRLSVADALWIFNNCDGSTVHIFTQAVGAPFDKPSTQQAVTLPGGRGYDPTDPAFA